MRPRAVRVAALLLTLSMVGLPALPAGSAAAAARPTEYEVKAAFLYNFARFVRWPKDTVTGPAFVVAVLGEDPFGPVLERTLTGKRIEERPIEVLRLLDPTQAVGAQIVFVSNSEQARLSQVLGALRGASVLTVGEMDAFADHGGMIAFRVQDELVRFDVNLAEADRARLKLSSQLLRLARRVLPAERGL